MPAIDYTDALDRVTAPADGLLMASLERRGRWSALRDLRAGMAELRQAGEDPSLSFVMAVSRDGRLVGGRDPDVALFILGYRFGG
jgi:hypothetical protein